MPPPARVAYTKFFNGFTLVKTMHTALPNSRCQTGFTLAEVLITLGIIGVVAAMTLQPLIAKYQEKVLLNQLQTAYNIIYNATSRLLDEESTTIKDFGTTPEEGFGVYQDKIEKYLKIIKICQANTNSKNDCNPDKIKIFNKENGDFSIDNYDTVSRLKTYVLSNGMKILFLREAGQCAVKSNFTYDSSLYDGPPYGTYGLGCGGFYVDVNGNKNPNTVGKDIFLFYLVQDGVIPAGMPQEYVWIQQFSSGGQYNYDRVTAWALFNKNMDYLRCDGLDWDGKKTCK